MSVGSIGPSQVAVPEEGNVVNGPAPAPPPRATQQSNEVGGSSALTPSLNSSGPADGARAATEPSKSGYEQFLEALNERLAIDPEYLAAKERLDTWGNVEALLDAVDRFTGLIPGDETITWANICAMAKDDVLPNPEAQAAAKKLMANRALFNEISGGKNSLTLEDARKFVETLKAAVASAKASATEEVKAELKERRASSTEGRSWTGRSSGNSDAAPIAMSTRPGVEGAMENLGNVADSLQAQMLELAKKAAEDPSKAVQYQQQIAQLQNQYQAITNMMNQLTQMISNLSKMWSDVAMNSIRNVK